MHGAGLGFAAAFMLYGPAAAAAQEHVLTSTTAPAPESAKERETTPICKTELRLSGTVYDENYPERSFALFQLKPNHAGELYREGMWVLTYEVLAIEPRGVLLRDSQGECWLRLIGNPAERAKAAAPPRPQRNKGKKGKGGKKGQPKGFVVVGKRR